jgi:enterochelin esterase-like enzyme
MERGRAPRAPARRRIKPPGIVALIAICAVAALGWLGPRAEAQGGLLADSRNRDAWRPSPIAGDWDAPMAERYAGSSPAATPTPAGPGATVTPTAPTTAATATRPAGAATQGTQTAQSTVTAAGPSATPVRGTPTVAAAQGTATAGGTGTAGPTGPSRTATTASAINTPAPGATTTQAATTATPANQPAATAPTATRQAETPSQSAAWREVRFQSAAVNREMPYLVWLPPGYPAPGTRYPVIYLLHGGGDGVNPNRTEWRNLGIGDVLEKRIKNGDFPNAILVLPEGLQGFWINHANGGPRWADYVSDELVANVDKTFQTDARPEKRIIGGLSMGGHGALQLALNHPDVFRIAAAHSPALRTYEDSPDFFGTKEWFARWDPLTLAKQLKPEDAKRLFIWMDTGERDRWRPSANELARVLDSRGTKVDLRVLSGEHDGAYWKNHMQEYADFYNGALRR